MCRPGVDGELLTNFRTCCTTCRDCCALQEGDRVVMVQEYADGGDLFNLLQKYGGCLSERVAVQMVLDPFLRVLQVCHCWQHLV